MMESKHMEYKCTLQKSQLREGAVIELFLNSAAISAYGEQFCSS